jgi:3-hydroxyisobutyrate dehydrogenase-like beta-hydroxyacid dehydrogenase
MDDWNFLWRIASLATNKNSLKKSPNIQNFNIVIICLKAKDESSNWLSKHHSTLAALTPTKLFIEMFEISRKYFFQIKNLQRKNNCEGK